MNLSQTVDESSVSTAPDSGVRRKTAVEQRSQNVRDKAEDALLAFLAKHGFTQEHMPRQARRFLDAWPDMAPLAFGREVSTERALRQLGEHPLIGQPAFELHVPEGKKRSARSCLVFVAEAKVNGRLERKLVARVVILHDET